MEHKRWCGPCFTFSENFISENSMKILLITFGEAEIGYVETTCQVFEHDKQVIYH